MWHNDTVVLLIYLYKQFVLFFQQVARLLLHLFIMGGLKAWIMCIISFFLLLHGGYKKAFTLYLVGEETVAGEPLAEGAATTPQASSISALMEATS